MSEHERCEICGWPLAESADKGCVPGDCSYRPQAGSAEDRRVRERRAQLTIRQGLVTALGAARVEINLLVGGVLTLEENHPARKCVAQIDAALSAARAPATER